MIDFKYGSLARQKICVASFLGNTHSPMSPGITTGQCVCQTNGLKFYQLLHFFLFSKLYFISTDANLIFLHFVLCKSWLYLRNDGSFLKRKKNMNNKNFMNFHISTHQTMIPSQVPGYQTHICSVFFRPVGILFSKSDHNGSLIIKW